jgi:hypothetical protein
MLGGSGQIRFDRCADRPDFALYAEHGNEFDGNNEYDRAPSWDPRRECRGYYFVRYFWNRLEHRLPDLVDTSSEWARFWRAVRRKPALLPTAFKMFVQYALAVGARVVLPFEAAPAEAEPTGAAAGPMLPPGSPTLLLLGASGPNVFTDDPIMEQAFREAYHSSPEMKQTVDDILRGQGRAPAVPAPQPLPESATTSLEAAGAVSPDVGWADELFAGENLLGKELDRSTYACVVMGHTHDARDEAVSRGRYLNTGTWAREADPTVVLAERRHGKVHMQLLRCTAAGALV